MGGYTAPEVVLIIAALGAVIVNIISSFRNNAKIDAISLKTSVIEGHVNSKETKYVEQIEAIRRENEILRSVIVDKDKDKALLAQSVVSRSRNQEPDKPSSNAGLDISKIPIPVPVKVVEIVEKGNE